MPTSPATDHSYLLKLITMLIRRAGGEIRIPAADLMGNDFGQGFTRNWDDDKKELVLKFAPKGSTLFEIREDVTWQGTKMDKGPRSLDPQAPLTREQLLALEWARTHGETIAETEAPNEKPARPLGRQGNVILTDEYQADRERQMKEKAAMDEILNFQTPSPERSRSAQRGERIAFSPPSKAGRVPTY